MDQAANNPPAVMSTFTERLLGGENPLGDRHVPGPVVSNSRTPILPGAPAQPGGTPGTPGGAANAGGTGKRADLGDTSVR